LNTLSPVNIPNLEKTREKVLRSMFKQESIQEKQTVRKKINKKLKRKKRNE